MAEERLILVVSDNPVIYDLTSPDSGIFIEIRR